MKIILSGGGTWGSVTALLALADELKKQSEEYEFLWIGTRNGTENILVEEQGINFKAIFSGKLRRYFSWQNFSDPFLILFGFFQAIFILKKFKPDRVLTAGSFVAVPMVWASWFLRIPVLVHQQDLSWGLANQLMRPFASWLTVNFEPTMKLLSRRLKRKAYLVGNPVREEIKNLPQNKKDEELIFKKFNLETRVPVVLVLGGGTGALRLNEIMAQAMPSLRNFCQVLHLTGKEKKVSLAEGEESSRYHWHELLTKEMIDAYQVADLVVARAGLGTLSELAVLGKPAIIIPIPLTHQEANARYFAQERAIINLDQNSLTPESLAKNIQELLSDEKKKEILAHNIKKLASPEAAQEIIKLIK